MSRSPSQASDRNSTASGLTNYFHANPANVNPAPAYVAPSGASQVVSEHHSSLNRSSSDEDEGGQASKDDGVQFSESALALVNQFLDQLLYGFLSTARSTSLLALRPAVTDVLKHRLAREAIQSAEEELQELLAGGEEEELNTQQNGKDQSRSKWDLELVWKRTRLRVMVYMRLGELEDDDEERFVKDEELFQGSETRFSHSAGLVSWAAAIFLTSVLEYVAEQTLQVAGQAAYSRTRRQSRSRRNSMSAAARAQTPEQIVVEDYDVEKVALNSTMGRLWRTWRKSLRGPVRSQHSLSRLSQSAMNYNTARRFSFGNDSVASDAESVRPGMALNRDDVPDVPDLPYTHYPEHVLASNIPLPIGKRDVDEIEVPGLAKEDPEDTSDDGSTTPTSKDVRRRSSLTNLKAQKVGGPRMPTDTGHESSEALSQKPVLSRQRSMSAPTLAGTRLAAVKEAKPPGSFPEDSNNDEAVKEDPVTLPLEPKSNMQEMAPHKRSAQDFKTLLDKVANNDSPDDVQSQDEKDRNHGLVAGAVAGASAAAAAAVAIVIGRKEEKGDTHLEPKDPRDVEELDKRKSLYDIKSLKTSAEGSQAGRESPEILTSRRLAVNAPNTTPELVRTGSGESKKSNRSFTLGDKNEEPVVAQQDLVEPHQLQTNEKYESEKRTAGSEDGIGVARTSDYIPSESLTPTQEQQARDGAQKPSRLLGAEAVPKSANSATNAQAMFAVNERPTTPKEFLQSRSLSTASNVPMAQSSIPKEKELVAKHIGFNNQPTQPATHTSTPANAPAHVNDVAATPNVVNAPYRQLRTAAVEKTDQRPKPLPTPVKEEAPANAEKETVVEHPVVRRIASLKRNEPKAVDGEGKPTGHTLTSASITSPEDFDTFVQGDETVKLTLTPENVRESPASDNLPYPPPAAKLTEKAAPAVSKKPSPPPLDTRTGRSRTVKQAAVAITEGERGQTSRADKRRSVSRPSPRNVSTHRKSGLIAREPQVMTESTRDLADYFRSTGPDKEQDIAIPILARRSTASLHSLGRPPSISNASVRSQSPGGDRTKSLTRSVMEAENIPPVPLVPPVPGKKGKVSSMQPRGTASSANGNVDLIDSIRSGPKQGSEHRISRSVAPLRSNTDSDQWKEIGDRINGQRRLNTGVNGSPSIKSTGASSVQSVRTSANSSSALLHNSTNVTAIVHPAHSGQPQRLSSTNGPSSGSLAAPKLPHEPTRKRYRNKDPYAIDSDGGDDDLLTALPRNRRQKESLAEFLNNTEPPKDNGPQPLSGGSGAQARSVMDKARANSLKAATEQANTGRMRSLQNSSAPKAGYAASVRSTKSPVSGHRQPHISSQVDSSAAANPAPALPKPKVKMESRTAGGKDVPSARLGAFHSNTKDLADFLRSSGPPESNSGAPAPIVGKGPKISPKGEGDGKKKTGVGGLFSSRKKRHTDMP